MTGRLVSIQAGAGGSVASLSYTYDAIGNLLTRTDGNTGLSETLVYDGLNRLTQSTVALSPTPLVKTYSYDPIGNLRSKSDLGTYTYPAAGAARPHAVSSISGGALTTSFSYDANGNQTAGLGRTIGYSAANMATSITQGARTVGFSYDPDHQRFMQSAPEGTTLYFSAFGVRAELLGNQWTEYLTVGGAMVGARVNNAASGTVAIRYIHLDHLGSVSVLTGENGAAAERNSYDAWGKRRAPGGTDDPSGSIISQTTRGFTGQEHLAEVGLIHFNARLYDPMVGRFTSADSIVPDPADLQSFNRYSYVRNRPLSAVDPSGHQDVPTIDIGTIHCCNLGTGGGSTFDPGSISLPNVPYNPYLPGISYGAGASYQANVSFNAVGNQIQYRIWLRSIGGRDPSRYPTNPLGNEGRPSQPAPAAPPAAAPAQTVAAGFAMGSSAYGYLSSGLDQMGAAAREGSYYLKAPFRWLGQVNEWAQDQFLAGVEFVAVGSMGVGDPYGQEIAAGVRLLRVKGGLGPVLRGESGVAQSIAAAEARGETVLGREITMQTAGGRTRPDLLVRDAQGNLKFIESKCGLGACLNPNQAARFPELEQLGGIPRGKNAAGAGLTPGRPIGPTPVQVDYWP